MNKLDVLEVGKHPRHGWSRCNVGISHHLWRGSRGYVISTSGTVGRGWNIASPMARQSGLCDIHLWVTNPNIIGTELG